MSNCQKGYIEALLDTTPLKPYITGHLCYGDTNCQKDVTIRRLMKQYDLKKVFYVGDTQGDDDACQKAEGPFILARPGLSDRRTQRAPDTAHLGLKLLVYNEQDPEMDFFHSESCIFLLVSQCIDRF